MIEVAAKLVIIVTAAKRNGIGAEPRARNTRIRTIRAARRPMPSPFMRSLPAISLPSVLKLAEPTKYTSKEFDSLASSMIFFAKMADFPCTRNPPSALTDRGTSTKPSRRRMDTSSSAWPCSAAATAGTRSGAINTMREVRLRMSCPSRAKSMSLQDRRARSSFP